MLNISGLKEGIVLDHIEAGRSLDIYYHLGLDKLDCQVAIIKNARSNKMGRKDIIKIEGGLDMVDLDMLGYIDHNITVNIIKDNAIAEKKTLKLPKKITNVIHCKNPRCITSIEQELPHIFYLADEKTETYRCQYCEEKYSAFEEGAEGKRGGIAGNSRRDKKPQTALSAVFFLCSFCPMPHKQKLPPHFCWQQFRIICFSKSYWPDSNRRPTDYESVALPTALQ